MPHGGTPSDANTNKCGIGEERAAVSLSGSSGLEGSSANGLGLGPTDQPLSSRLQSHQPVEGDLCPLNPSFVIWMWQIPSERMQGRIGTYHGTL